MKNVANFSIVLITLGMLLNQAEAKRKGCLGDSKMKISKNMKSTSMNHHKYKDLYRRAQETLGPIILKHYNKMLIFKDAWDEDRVNAHATRDWDDNAVITVNGGMARHPLMNEDVFFLLVCHELGHQFGGAPKQFRGRSQRRSWSSAEGQADYFATMKCFPHLAGEKKSDTNSQFSEICQDDPTCLKTAETSFILAQIYAEVKHETIPSLSNKDPNLVNRTVYGHSNSQCRLDTMIEGSKCARRLELPLDSIDPSVNTCVRDGYRNDLERTGVRPRCWYFPRREFR